MGEKVMTNRKLIRLFVISMLLFAVCTAAVSRICVFADTPSRTVRVGWYESPFNKTDESGRRSPVPVEGKTVTIPVDLVIVAVGVSPNPLIPSSVEGLEIGKKGTIVVNEGMQSNLPMIFAGGDIVRGGATVILAMSDGRKAAKAMHEYLSK